MTSSAYDRAADTRIAIVTIVLARDRGVGASGAATP
jgi:hypothetical protein